MAAFAPSPSTSAAAPAALLPDDFATSLLTLMNEGRTEAGLPSLDRAGDVDQVAEYRAVDMASNSYFAHVNPDGLGAVRLLDDYHVLHTIVGENIARSDYPADQVIQVVHRALMASQEHRSNVLEPRFHRVGVGVATVGDMYYFAVVFID